jgi:hypothetical protein
VPMKYSKKTSWTSLKQVWNKIIHFRKNFLICIENRFKPDKNKGKCFTSVTNSKWIQLLFFFFKCSLCFHFMLGFILYTNNYKFTLVTYKLHYEITTNYLTQRGDHTYQAIRSTITRNCRAEIWQTGHVTMFAVFGVSSAWIVNRSWTECIDVLNDLVF